jgi:5-methylthioadenosine/S-adenosylhomocysteine deaminase
VQRFEADWTLVDGTFRAGHAVLVSSEGEVVAVGEPADVAAHPGAEGAERVDLPGQALLPGTVSAHSHAFQVFLRGWADHPRSFSDWVERFLYPLVLKLDDKTVEAAALLCFAQMARAGITSVGEFHYLHNGPAGEERGEQLADLVLGAARRVGLRVAFLRAVYDQQRRPGQARMAQPVERALAGLRATREAWAHDPRVSVAPAPHSLHGASREAIEASAAAAKELGVPWHIHLAEQEEDVPFAQRRYGATPLRALESWGVLDARTVLVHGIWLDGEERRLLAARGGALVTNPTTNMALGDGIADLPDLLDLGVPVAVGTDMNACPNVFAEVRAAEYLQRVRALKMGCLAGSAAGAPDPSRVFALATEHGARALGLPVGALEVGRRADLVAVRLGDPSLLPASALGGDALLGALVSGMTAETAISGAWVDGRRILSDGVLAGLPSEELEAAVQRCAPALAELTS